MKATKVTSKKALNERKTMGLAASQARLLTITARKSDCEFQSMRLSHEKIALARSMEKISDEYQAALGQTKLVYDYYGSGTSPMPLNYNLLTTPSVYNDYYPKLITDKTNRVVLDSKLAAAAQAAGIPVEGLAGTPSDAIRNTFIQALCGENIISKETAASIQNVNYGNSIGLGSTFNITQTQESIDYKQFLNLVKAKTVSTLDFGLQVAGSVKTMTNPADPNLLWQDDIGPQLYLFHGGTTNPREYDDYTKLYDDEDNVAKSNSQAKNYSISLYDLINNTEQYVVQLKSPYGSATTMTENAFLQQWLCGSNESANSFLNWINQQMLAVIGDGDINTRAIQYANDQLYNILYPNHEIQDLAYDVIERNDKYNQSNRHHREGHDNGEDNKEWRDAIDTASSYVKWGYKANTEDETLEASYDYIGPVHSYCKDAGNGKNKQTVSVNLNNVVQAYMTALLEYYEIQENGTTSYSYGLGKKENATLASTTDFENTSFLLNTTSDISMGDENVAASFYDAMFNMICSNGWVKNEQIIDAEYMQEMFKNGTIFISSIGNDGFYYQGNYNTDKFISEVPDEEAIAQAEAKYNSEKSKIQSKEDTLDVKMKNLDTEISSLTTEYDTTKSIIQKAIEKSFKRYEA